MLCCIFLKRLNSSVLCGLSTNTTYSHQLDLSLCPHHMQLAALQREPPVHSVVGLKEGDDSNDNDDVEDDG